MKTRCATALAIVLAMVLGLSPATWAASADHNSNVEVRVGTILSITFEDDPNFQLVFDTDFSQGAVSSGKTIVYKVRANNMSLAAIQGAISAKISTALSGIDIKAFPGDYLNDGASGYATLDKVADEVVVGTTPVRIFDKPASSGSSGKLLTGRVPIHYRAVATRDLSTTDGGTFTLTVTLKDS